VSSSEEFCVISDPRDHQLIVFPQVVLNKMLEKADEITLGEFERRDALRALTSHGHTSSFDAHGRIMLTGDLLQQAEITKEAVLVGVFNKFEIWAPHRIVEVEHATAEKATDGAKALGI
jgi:MraZ protein